MSQKSWFIKYAPQTADELIFDNDKHEELVKKWLDQEYIDGNVLMFGSFGLGKTVTAEILIRQIIKAQNDVFIARDRSVKEIRERIQPFLTKKPVKSKQKIVYIEEMDKMHKDAFNLLKTGMMEKYQDNCAFIGCTNYIKKIEGAVQTRFNFKLPFNGSNTEGIIKRMQYILDNENAKYDQGDLVKFVYSNQQSGIRELINSLQNSFIANDGNINFENIQKTGSIEGNLIELIKNIINIVMSLDAKGKKLALDYPENSQISEDYRQLVSTLHNNIDINYDSIYDAVYNITRYIPLKTLCARYADQQEYKKFPHINLLGFLYEVIRCVSEVNRV